MSRTPFTDPDSVSRLYLDPTRLARRTGALRAAKISGDDATDTIADLAARVAPPHPLVWDIGCGRGTTTLTLTARLNPRQIVALDRSPALLATARDRAAAAGHELTTMCVDFHQLPPQQGVDIAVAAFCLYHSPRPELVVAQIAHCLAASGHAVLATKSVDSYAEIDRLVDDLGLDPDAASHPSLYRAFHSDNAHDVTATALHVLDVVHQHHVFRFTDPQHLARYLSTTPKYRLPHHLANDPDALTAAVRDHLPGYPITTTSTVTYVLATRR